MQSNHWKPILYLLLAVVSTQLMSCRPTPQYPEALLLADSLTQCNADSAVRLLQELAPTISQAKEPVRRYHQLLTIKAQDKAFIPHTSDSLVLTLLRYYQEEGDPRLLPEACYYAGRVTRDLGDAPQALDYFHQALDALQTSDYQSRMQGQEERTLKLQGKIHAQMGYLFRDQHLYDEAIKAMEATYRLDSVNRDTVGMLFSLRDLGDIFRTRDDYDKAISLYDKATNLAIIVNDTQTTENIALQKALIYNKQGYSFLAKEIIEKDSVITDNSNYVSVYAILARIYSGCGDYAMATKYFSRLLTCNNISARSSASLWLGNRANIEGNSDKALKYIRTYMQLEDSLNSLRSEEAIALSQSLYNYQLREKEIHKFQIKEYKNKAYIWMVIAIASVFLILLYMERARRIKIKLQCELLQGLVAASKKDTELKKSIAQAAMNGLRNDEGYKYLKNLCEGQAPLKAGEWSMVEDLLSSYFPDFLPKLRGIYSYNETEWRLSMLLKMDFSWLEIASLTGRSYTAVYSSQTRLLKKVFPSGSEYNNWMNFISTL